MDVGVREQLVVTIFRIAPTFSKNGEGILRSWEAHLRLLMIIPLITINQRARTPVESTLERHTAGEGLPAVRERARELAAASVNANTRRAYEGALRRLRDWLAGRLLDDATLAEYLAARFEAGHSPAVAGQVVAAVRFYAKLGGQLAARGAVTKLRMWTPPWLASLTSNRGRWQSGQVRSLRGVGTPVGGGPGHLTAEQDRLPRYSPQGHDLAHTRIFAILLEAGASIRAKDG